MKKTSMGLSPILVFGFRGLRTLRKRKNYFKEMLEESNGRFSKALMLYAGRMVKTGYIPDFKQFCDYTYLEQLLDGEDIPELIYEKKDGCRLKLRVLNFSTYSGSPKETLWIFSDLEEAL